MAPSASLATLGVRRLRVVTTEAKEHSVNRLSAQDKLSGARSPILQRLRIDLARSLQYCLGGSLSGTWQNARWPHQAKSHRRVLEFNL